MPRLTLLPAFGALALMACEAQSDPAIAPDASVAAYEAAAPADTSAAPPSDTAPAVTAGQARRRPSQSQAESRLQAFYAIWGRPAPVGLDTPFGRQTFSAGEVSYLGSGRAMLVAYGDAVSPGGKGGIALRYLTEGTNGLEAGPGQLLLIESGLGSTGQTDWAIRRDIMSDPVMIIENNGPWGEYSCVGANLVALTATGPVLLQPGDRRVRPLPNPDNLPLC